MANRDRQRLYDVLQEAEREWRAYKAAGCEASDAHTFVGSAWYEGGERRGYRRHEQELFERVEAARKAWLDSWTPGQDRSR